MLARIGRTLSTNAAIGALALVVLGAGGTTVTLAASPSPSPQGGGSSAEAKTEKAEKDKGKAEKAKEKADRAKDEADEAEDSEDGTRRTDTHGYCVSRIAKATSQEHTGTGPDKVNHGRIVSAAAHACGKDGKLDQARFTAEKAKKAGKHGRGHGTGRPSGVAPRASERP